MSILYGVGAALTLDEFALWLNLANVYWSPRGTGEYRRRGAVRQPAGDRNLGRSAVRRDIAQEINGFVGYLLRFRMLNTLASIRVLLVCKL